MADLPKGGKATPAAPGTAPNCSAARSLPGLTMEDMELILSRPWSRMRRKPIGSMGDDTPLAVISDKPRHVAQFFRQNFSQVTNPPIDSLRERHVMSLKTRFSNLANILDEKGQSDARSRDRFSPVLVGEDWDRLRAYFGDAVADIDCTFRRQAATPRPCARRSRASASEAEDAVRAGRSELFLSDQNRSAKAASAMAMVLAAAAVHTHLVRKGLRSYASINVRSAEVLDTHAFAVLDRRGRDDRPCLSRPKPQSPIGWTRGLFGGELSLGDCQPPLPQGDRRWPAEDHGEDGDRGDLQLSRRL
jgi:glutamate synthase (NADPH/NADH) large chain